MLREIIGVAVIAILLLLYRTPSPAMAQGGTDTQQLLDHVGQADRIVKGTVSAVESQYASNDLGDHYIISTVTVSVSETLKGRRERSVVFSTIGGTVGGFSMASSHYHTPVEVNDSVVALTVRGQMIHHGLIKLNAADETTEGIATVAQVRAAVRGEF